MYLITWIATYLPTHEGRMDELAMLADPGQVISTRVQLLRSSIS